MSRRPESRASRRGVLTGLVVGLGATGCQLDPPRDEPDASEPSPTAAAPRDDDPDAVLVERVIDDLTGALALVAGAAAARRPLRRELAPWRSLHAAHLRALEAPGRVGPLRVGGPLPDLRARVRRQESGLQRRLAESAVAARSGPLASLLATMSAGVAQQLAADAEGARG